MDDKYLFQSLASSISEASETEILINQTSTDKTQPQTTNQQPAPQSLLPPQTSPLLSQTTPPTLTNPKSKPKPKAQGQLLMEIIAISGEYPASNIPRIIPALNYGKKLVSALIGDRLIKLVSSGGLRGYRLTPKGKKKLLTNNPERFSGFLDGTVETNKVRSGYERRLRLRSIAEVCAIMHNVGIEIFQDTKPKIYQFEAQPQPKPKPIQSPIALATNFTQSRPKPTQTISPKKTLPQITSSSFYLSREQKNQSSNAIRGSRAIGTLLTSTDVYAIYNTGSIESKWVIAVEGRYKAEIHHHICRNLLYHQYKGKVAGGIMIGDGFDVLGKYLIPKEKRSTGFDFLYGTYHPFYYITNDSHGENQLKILCDSTKISKLNSALSRNYLPKDPKHPIEHDAITQNGNPVLFCCLLDIPRLIQFHNGLAFNDMSGVVIALDFQLDMLKRYLGEDKAHFVSLGLDKIMDWLFSEDKT